MCPCYLQVAGNVIEDLKGVQEGKPGREGMPHLPGHTTWQDWKKIEQVMCSWTS